MIDFSEFKFDYNNHNNQDCAKFYQYLHDVFNAIDDIDVKWIYRTKLLGEDDEIIFLLDPEHVDDFIEFLNDRGFPAKFIGERRNFN